MSNVLICYGSVEGQTRKICNVVAQKIEDLGHQVHVVDAADPPEGEWLLPDALIVAAPLHEHQYPSAVRRYLTSVSKGIAGVPGMFLSVSLAAMSDEEDDRSDLERTSWKFFDDVEWTPQEVHQVAGALRYTELNFFKRFVLKQIMRAAGGPTDTHEDYEFTDWEALDKIVEAFAAQYLGTAAVA